MTSGPAHLSYSTRNEAKFTAVTWPVVSIAFCYRPIAVSQSIAICERVLLEPIYCLGLCATAPSAMLDGRVVGRLDEARIDALVAEAQR